MFPYRANEYIKGIDSMAYDLEDELRKTALSISNSIRGSQEDSICRFTFDSIYDIRVNDACSYPLHFHNSFELIYIVSPGYQCILNKSNLVLNAGDILLSQPGDLHSDSLSPGCHYFGIGFFMYSSISANSDIRIFKSGLDAESQCFRTENSAVLPLITAMSEELAKSQRFSYNILDAFLQILIWNLIRRIADKNLGSELLSRSRGEEFRNNFMVVLQSCMDAEFDLESVAAKMNISPSSLSHKAKELFQMSPYKLFIRLKMDRASELVRGTDFSIKEISELLGFKNQYHFSKVFKEYNDLSPLRYREKAKLGRCLK